jgi:methyltransferase
MHQAAALLAFITLQRLVELNWAAQNTARLMASGGVEFGRHQYPWMVALHTAWLAGLWLVGYNQPVDFMLVIVFALLQCGRLWVLASLGRRWTTRIIILPNTALVTRGPYRLLKHPNYLIVIGEIAVVPLALGLPIYAALFSLLNSVVLTIRIRTENRALLWAGRKGDRRPSGGAEPDAC